MYKAKLNENLRMFLPGNTVQTASVQLCLISTCCQTYYTQYMLPTHADCLLCLQLHTIVTMFFIWHFLVLLTSALQEALWNITPHSLEGRYQCYTETWCMQFKGGKVTTGAATSSKISLYTFLSVSHCTWQSQNLDHTNHRLSCFQITDDSIYKLDTAPNWTTNSMQQNPFFKSWESLNKSRYLPIFVKPWYSLPHLQWTSPPLAPNLYKINRIHT